MNIFAVDEHPIRATHQMVDKHVVKMILEAGQMLSTSHRVLDGDEYYDNFTAIPNNAGSGKTGDIDFTTVGHSSGDSYMIILEMIKKYD